MVESHATLSNVNAFSLDNNMETLLKQCSRDDGTIFTLEIPNVYGEEATLYVLNGGTRPQDPKVGDFAYDISTTMIQVRHPNDWRSITVPDVKSLVQHPNSHGTVVAFTSGAIPFWNDAQESNICKFDSVAAILSHFRQTFDPSKLKSTIIPPASHIANGNVGSHSESEIFTPHSCELIVVIQKEDQMEMMTPENKVKARISVSKKYAWLIFIYRTSMSG